MNVSTAATIAELGIPAETIPSVIGPLSNSLEGCVVFLRAVLAGRPWNYDPAALALPFNERAYRLEDLGLNEGSESAVTAYKEGSTKLCFGIWKNDGEFHAHPPLIRALKETKEQLLAAGHQVLDLEPFQPATAAGIVGDFWMADAGQDLATEAAKGGEPV